MSRRRRLPYFYLSTARDPRPIIVHEGVPGHYMQLALAWAHENPIRRHYYDSGANEGIGFYAEEMMLQAGLWAESPRSREIIYNFARLRALRVEVDVRLATGTFTIPQAAEYLEKTVPMDRDDRARGSGQLRRRARARRSPTRSASCRSSGMLADARRARGDALLAARVPRHGVEERQRPVVAAALGDARRSQRSRPPRRPSLRQRSPGEDAAFAHGATSTASAPRSKTTRNIPPPQSSSRWRSRQPAFRKAARTSSGVTP